MSPRQQKSHAEALRWFKEKKRDLHREIRAFNDFVVARDAVLRIQEGIDPELDPHLQITSALFHQAVNFYARQFKQAHNQYAEKQNYPARSLTKRENFDSSLHAHLIELRDRLVAHNDSRELPPHINVLHFNASQDAHSAEVPIGASLTSYSLATVSSGAFLKRLASHLIACVEVVERKITDGLHHYVDEAIKYPTANGESREGQTLKDVIGKSISLVANETIERLDLDLMRDQLVKEPMSSLSGEQYTFRMMGYSILKPSVTFLLNGNEMTIHLRNDLRSKRDVKRLVPKPVSALRKRWHLVVSWFKAPFFEALPGHDEEGTE